MNRTALTFFLLLCAADISTAAEPLVIGRLKYGGGGDWYSNPGSLENLADFISGHTSLQVSNHIRTIDPSSDDLFSVHYLYMNGHGNIRFTDEEIRRLRFYFENGGFLHADDNYGMDASFRREMKRIFPDGSWVELPFGHPIYHQAFSMDGGLPKVHEHDGRPPQGLALFHQGEPAVFYTYECDLGDGWEDPEVHGDPEAVRIEALRMGTNIFLYHLRPTANP